MIVYFNNILGKSNGFQLIVLFLTVLKGNKPSKNVEQNEMLPMFSTYPLSMLSKYKSNLLWLLCTWHCHRRRETCGMKHITEFLVLKHQHHQHHQHSGEDASGGQKELRGEAAI